jgi:hypothetical protein
MAKAQALLIVPEEVDQAAPGETLWAIRLDEVAHMEQAPF